jgi:large subunit ribosomal protein L10
MSHERNPAQWKVEFVDNLSKEISESPVSAIVSIKGLRNKQLQSIRRNLSSDMKLRVVRIRLLMKALDRTEKKNIKSLEQFAEGQIGLVTTKLPPSKLYKLFEGTKEKAAARGGETAPDDIIIPEMTTNFPPGPMISEFQKAGIQTAIDKGKIAIKKEILYVKKGEPIPKDKAKILEKLEIHPLTVGLDILGAYSDGILFSREAISITEEQIMLDMARAFSQARELAVSAMFLVPEIIPQLIVKAKINAEYLALESGFIDESNVQLFILKAIREASALNSAMGNQQEEEKPEKAKEEKTEETTEDAASDEDKVSEGLGSLFG